MLISLMVGVSAGKSYNEHRHKPNPALSPDDVSDAGDDDMFRDHSQLASTIHLLLAVGFILIELFFLVYALQLAMAAPGLKQSDSADGTVALLDPSNSSYKFAHVMFALFATTPYVFSRVVLNFR